MKEKLKQVLDLSTKTIGVSYSVNSGSCDDIGGSTDDGDDD